jgi:hypothetical protein
MNLTFKQAVIAGKSNHSNPFFDAIRVPTPNIYHKNMFQYV